MNAVIPKIVLALLAGSAASLLFHQLTRPGNPIFEWARRYQAFWDREIAASHLSSVLRSMPLFQLTGAPLLILWSTKSASPLAVLAACTVAVVLPPALLHRLRFKRREALENDLDAFLVGLSDALTAIPNLTEALDSLHENLAPPLKDEIQVVLSEVRLGRSIDDALGRLAKRLDLPALHAAVGAALLSHRVGGDLSRTLRRIAAATREMARLEGVVKSKTAEGRTQAWVIGLLPPALIYLIDKVDPGWLAPLFDDPIGWIFLGAAAILELMAIGLIRRIMAVDI
jgi:tight adherence protein B